MTDTPGDDVANMDEDAGSTVRSDDEARPDLPGVSAGDVDPMSSGADQDAAEAAGGGGSGEGPGLGDTDDVEPGAGAVEPPD